MSTNKVLADIEVSDGAEYGVTAYRHDDYSPGYYTLSLMDEDWNEAFLTITSAGLTRLCEEMRRAMDIAIRREEERKHVAAADKR